MGRSLKLWGHQGLSPQLAKRWKDSDRDDFLDDFGSENEGELRAHKLKSPPAQQVRKEKGAGGEGKKERTGWKALRLCRVSQCLAGK